MNGLQHTGSAAESDRWYADWFNHNYLELYAHRDDREARSLADLLSARLPHVERGTTLDLCCGAGRHVKFLNEWQPTIGLDLSPWLLDVARTANPGSPLVRADMQRLPFRDAAFTLVVNLFTSFGYFLDDAHNADVLREVSRVTALGGWLVLDFLNASRVRHTVVPFARTQVASTWIREQREVSGDGRYVRKTITLESTGETFTERVRLFEPGDFDVMLADCGFRVADVCGDYDGQPLSASSPRAIFFARRAMLRGC